MQTRKPLWGLALLVIAPLSYADLSNLEGLFSSELEENSALANQATYERLREAGCDDQQRGPTETCDGTMFRNWAAVREIVHTANELTDSGPATFSLGLDLENLGYVLRWSAGEEFSTQGDMSTNFVRGQMAGLASRVSAIRAGSRGFAMNVQGNSLIASTAQEAYGGGGASDEIAMPWSPWGVFFNIDSRFGKRDATEREDAFDFDGVNITGGVDYRFSAQWVAGVMLGYQSERLEFDYTKSIADGDVEMSGLSIQPYVLYNAEKLYASAALGIQSMDFDTYRVITYPSLNPLVPSTDTAATSSTSGDALSLSGTLGYAFLQQGAWGVDAFMTLDYRDVTVDAYTETDINNKGFAFMVAEQSFDELESSLGVKINYVVTPSYGVFIPFLDLEFRTQHNTDPRYINALYVDAADTLSDAPQAYFSLPGDKPDSNYWVYTLGVSAVLRGASQSTADAPASGGIQAFIHYRGYQALEYYTQGQIAAGVRYEF